MWQAELEHRIPKARYMRTDKKKFVKQLTQIERRQARLRRIKAQFPNRLNHKQADKIERNLRDHHNIGLSQYSYEHIGTFLRVHAEDPAVKVREP